MSTKSTTSGTKNATSSTPAASTSTTSSGNTAAYTAQLASQQQSATNDQSENDSQTASDANETAKALTADKMPADAPSKDSAADAASVDAKASAALTVPAPAAAGVQPANVAASAAQANAPMSAATVSAVIQQVTVHLTKAAVDGIDHIKVQLNPPELGHVEVRMEVGPSGHFSAVFAADRPQTVDMLQRNAHELTRSLQDAGIRTDTGSLSFNLRNQNQQNNTPWSGGFSATRTASPSWSSAPDDTPMPAAVYASPAAGTNRVDIRV